MMFVDTQVICCTVGMGRVIKAIFQICHLHCTQGTSQAAQQAAEAAQQQAVRKKKDVEQRASQLTSALVRLSVIY